MMAVHLSHPEALQQLHSLMSGIKPLDSTSSFGSHFERDPLAFSQNSQSNQPGSVLSSKGLILNSGLASLDRWEGLKDWHRRHQDLLQKRSNEGSVVEKHAEDSEPRVTNTNNPTTVADKDTFFLNGIHEPEFLPRPPQKHDLSIIPETDEESRIREEDCESVNSRARNFPCSSLPQLDFKEPPVTLKERSGSATARMIINHNTKAVNEEQQVDHKSNVQNGKVGKRPFLRRGQGLVRYSLRPEDVKHPYKKEPSRKVNQNNQKQSAKIQPNRQHVPQTRKKLELKDKREPEKHPLTTDAPLPTRRLVLTAPPQKGLKTDIGTWSQLFGGDNVSVEKETRNDTVKEVKSHLFPQARARQQFFQEKMGSVPASPSPKCVKDMKCSSPPEEDQESLAAYLDLEQHVGNSSFCSTSSKVDRLVARSSSANLHPSNPDTICQSKPPSPRRSVRGSVSNGKDFRGTVNDPVSMWTTAELEDLIQACARRSEPFSQADRGSSRRGAPLVVPRDSINNNQVSDRQRALDVSEKSDDVDCITLTSNSGKESDINALLNTVSQTRKPHLMKTMSGIDLDSSLVRNALNQSDDKFTESESDSSSSETSKSDESENESSTMAIRNSASNKVLEPSAQSRNISIRMDSSTAGIDASAVEAINKQIKGHLSHLRQEIETLQSANSKSQKNVTSLERKVHELEQRLILEARASEKRLEQEREAASKMLSEERAKFQKDKQSLEKTVRELRKKVADSLPQKELMNLKQEIAQWEEKWRTDRAKARGLESNLRIQITNLKRENERLKEESSKSRREMETAVNAAKAKAASNTKSINSIAQQLDKCKLRGSYKEERNIVKKNSTSKPSSSNILSNTRHNSKPVATIGTFPRPPASPNEWSSDEELDLGSEASDEALDEIHDENLTDGLKLTAVDTKDGPSSNNGKKADIGSILGGFSDVALEETQAKYDALFGQESSNYLFHTDTIPQAPKKNEIGHKEGITQAEKTDADENLKSDKFVKTVHHSDGSVEQLKKNGTKVITHANGTWERRSANGSTMIVPPSGWPVRISYFNGDQLEKLSDGTVRYFYAKTSMWQTTYPDGHEELQYPDTQVERQNHGSAAEAVPSDPGKANDGKRDSHIIFSDGVSIEQNANGDTVILLPNGERELHTKEYMRKDFLDGTVKFVYTNGSQETRYPSGRIRIKDGQGNLIKDTALGP